MTASSLHLIYIAGAGRSGSTLLSNVLGQLPGACNVGELYYLWERGLQQNILCGCGQQFNECQFWTNLLRRVETTMGIDDINRHLENGIKGTRTRHIPYLLTDAGREQFADSSQPFIRLLCHIYAAIHEQTGCDYIVDASKFPTYGFLLTQIPGVIVTVIHLIRDPRAVAFSWQRRKFNPDSGQLFGRMSSGRSAAIWVAWNLGAEVLGRSLRLPHRYIQLRYESFIERPQETLERIAEVAGWETDPLSVVRHNMVTMRPGHTIAGNPVRFHESMELRLDTEWKKGMPVEKQRLTSVFTWPLLRRYGYPVW